MFDFGRATPHKAQTDNDRLGQAGTLIGDVADFHRGAAGGAGGFIGDAMLGISELRDGNYFAGAGVLASGALSGVQMVSPQLAASMPGLGVAAGAAQAIGYGAEAMRHTDQIDAGYRNNKFWSNAGWATVGGLQAAAALDPTGASSMAVAGGSFALNGIGALAGMIDEDWRFSAGSAVGAAEHLVFDTGQALGKGAVWAGEHIADGASAAWNAAGDAASNTWDTVSDW